MTHDPDELLRIGASLRLDAVAGELVDQLDTAGVRALVIRGPALRHLLYAEGGYRAYDDVDLLVPPDALDRARSVLRAAGFTAVVEGDRDRAQPWSRPDGAVVDLHTSVVGVGASAARVWHVLAAAPQALDLAGRSIEIPDNSSVALLVALHAAQHGRRAGKAISDLERALEQWDEPIWAEAAAKAAELDALPAFAAGLGLAPDGARLAGRLGLETAVTPEVALRVASAPPVAVGLQRLADTRGLAPKLKLVLREVVPSAPFLRAVYPIARRGRLGLTAAYIWRPAWLLWHVIPAQRARRRARRRL